MRGPLRSERLLVAAGRRPDLSSLGVGTVGLDPSARLSRGRWAYAHCSENMGVGDVTGVGAFLTHVGIYRRLCAIPDILGESPRRPTVGPFLEYLHRSRDGVGRNGPRRKPDRSGSRVASAARTHRSSARGWIHKAGNAELVELVGDADRGVLVGALSMGPVGGEVLGLLTLAIHAQVANCGASIHDLRLPDLPSGGRGCPSELAG